MAANRAAGRVVAALCAALIALAMVLAPTAAAASCPDAEVVFARGRLEPPGVGQVGSALVGALRSRMPAKNLGVYPVNYAANTDVAQGANDMSGHIQYMASTCPDTRLVLGGYSLGAAVTDVVLAVSTPVLGFTRPLPAGTDQHVAAVALFGNGSQWVAPITAISPLYRDRTIEVCHGADPVCTPADPIPGRATGPTTVLTRISNPAWSIRPPTSSRASFS